MKKKPFLKVWPILTGITFFLLCLVPFSTFAADDVQSLNKQVEMLQEQLKAVQDKLNEMEAASTEKEEQIDEMDDRLNKAELHSATDKLAIGVELRTRAESIHYSNVQFASQQLLGKFFTPYNFADPMSGGLNGATYNQIGTMLPGLGMSPLNVAESADADNDIIYTNKFRINLYSKFNDHLSFDGRLAAYKVYGDSTGVKFNQGSLGDVTFDGTTTSLPHGDTIRLERVSFHYKNDWGSVPVGFSLGRRPSTEGTPLEYMNNSLVGGSPLAHIINWQFDGASLSFGLEDATGIPGLDFKLCYGVGFEGGWGNSSSLNASSEVDDVHMLGFIATLFNNDMTSIEMNYAHAWDITDGFTGLTVMPFIVSVRDQVDADGDPGMDGTPEYYFDQNYGAFISRLEPTANIGDWDAITVLFKSNLSDWLGDIDVFLSGALSHTDPSRISANPFYGLMGMGLLSSNGELKGHEGYSIYTGASFPVMFGGRLGFEYNWGSKYWFNFTGAEDSLIGSKLATRGNVFEGYYHQPIYDQNFFFTLGGRIYNYEYTGSGNPLGKPVKISEVTALDALFPVADEVWDAYLSFTFRY